MADLEAVHMDAEQWRSFLAENDAVIAERDDLRAEVDRLTKHNTELQAELKRLCAACERATARMEELDEALVSAFTVLSAAAKTETPPVGQEEDDGGE